jgi:hypothetical protein
MNDFSRRLFDYAADLSRAEARRLREKRKPARRIVATGKRINGRWLYAVDGDWTQTENEAN